MNDQATFDSMLADYLSSNVASFYKSKSYCYVELAKSGKFTRDFLNHAMWVTSEYGNRLWAAANGGKMPRV